MKRTIALVVMLLMCFGIFMGCGSDGGDTATSSSQTGVTDGIFSTDDIKFIDENGESVYRITRPDGDEYASSKASNLFKLMKSTLGINAKNTADTVDGTDKYEILIGNTNRLETKQAKEYLIKNIGGRINDYIVCTVGKKIVIFGMSDEALDKACTYFYQTYVQPENIKTDGIKGGIKYIVATEGNFQSATINGTELGFFVFVKQRYNESYITQQQIEDANKLLTEKMGYKLEIVEDHKDASEYEIIIGNAKREGVTEVANKDEYTIKISGKKVYLNGGSPAAKAMAVSEFAKMLTSGVVTDQSSVTASYSQTIASYDTSKYLVPTWTDDFDEPSASHATGVDLTKWAWGTDSAQGHNNRTSVRSQDPAHLFISDGMLNFYATYDADNYYGFKLVTKNKMTFRYGVLEMSAILPHGDAFWISLWANSYDPESSSAFFTEVNVVEMFGNSASEASNLHGWLKSDAASKAYYADYWEPQGIATHWSLDGSFSGDKRYQCPEGNFNDGLHTFTYIWSQDECSFACDGNVYFSLNPNDNQLWAETFNQPIYLILSQATCFASGSGKNMPDDASEWTTSNNFQIDYVHIYQKNDGFHTLNYFG